MFDFLKGKKGKDTANNILNQAALEDKAKKFDKVLKDLELFIVPPTQCFVCQTTFKKEHKVSLQFMIMKDKDCLAWAHNRCVNKQKLRSV